jgi:hypothetical protein
MILKSNWGQAFRISVTIIVLILVLALAYFHTAKIWFTRGAAWQEQHCEQGMTTSEETPWLRTVEYL